MIAFLYFQQTQIICCIKDQNQKETLGLYFFKPGFTRVCVCVFICEGKQLGRVVVSSELRRGVFFTHLHLPLPPPHQKEWDRQQVADNRPAISPPFE